MNIKRLLNATKFAQKIQELDKQIIEIEAQAIKIANGEMEASFSLNIQSKQDKKKEQEEERENNNDSSNLIGYYPTFFGGSFLEEFNRARRGRREPNSTLRTYCIKSDINESETLNILSFILAAKIKERNQLIEALEQNGVKF
jgi:hypothetical protein